MNTLQELKNKRKELLAQILEESKKFFTHVSKEIFKNHPKLESFSWTQYTPYFNDGDECRFSAHTDNLDFVFDGKEHEGVDNYYLKTETHVSPEFRQCVKDVATFLENFDDSDLEEMFEDHVKVVVSAKGVDTQEYEHD